MMYIAIICCLAVILTELIKKLGIIEARYYLLLCLALILMFSIAFYGYKAIFIVPLQAVYFLGSSITCFFLLRL